MQTDCSSGIFPLPCRILVRKPFSPCDSCSCTAVGTKCMPPEGRGAACCSCCCEYLLPGIAEFCDFLPAERSRCGPAVILKVREMVRSYTDLSRNQPSTLVVREGCWMFDWHNFCNSQTTGTKHVTTLL